MDKLNEQQMEAVCHGDGPMLVLAGPGSGKTTMITRRVLHMTGRLGIRENQILVMTYTKAAAQEMCGRFLRLKGTQQTEVCFGTFHSVFLRMLKEQGQCPFNEVLTGEAAENLMAQILKEKYEVPLTEGKELAGAILSEYSKQRNTGEKFFPLPDWSAQRCLRCVEWYEKRKRERHCMDFDDMLSLAGKMLQREETARYYQNRFPYILVDEFQDINPRQYQILLRLAGQKGNVFAVGDDDQAIYGFRGASPQLLRQFAADFHPCQILTLKWNYRSTKQIVTFSQNLVRHNRDRFEKKMSAAKNQPGEPVRQMVFDRQEQEAIAMAERFRKLRRKGVRYDQIAVLLRSSYQAEPICAILEDYGISCRCGDVTSSPYGHWIGGDAAAFWRAAAGERSAFQKILTIGARKIPLACMTWMEENEPPRTLLQKKLPAPVRLALEELFYELDHLLKEGPSRGFHRIYKRLGYEAYLRSAAEKAGIAARELYGRFDFFQREAQKYSEWEEWETGRQEAISQAQKDGADSVRIMTLHGAKGLEFPIVWIPGVEQKTLPHERSRNLQEERRLLYVGCTRARERLYLSCCLNRRGQKKQPSIFWEEGRISQ